MHGDSPLPFLSVASNSSTFVSLLSSFISSLSVRYGHNLNTTFLFSTTFTLVVPAIVTPEPYHHDPHDKFRSRRPMFCTTVAHVHAVRYVAVEHQQINVSVTLVDACAASSLLVQTRAKPLRLRMSFHGTQDRK